MSNLPPDAGTTVVRIASDAPRHDMIVAELAELGFYAFASEDAELLAYIPSALYSPDVARSIRSVVLRFESSAPTTSDIPAQNWNALWEASVSPISVPPFVIRPSWSPATGSLFEIVIDPKMSFGTAHHESTRLLLGFLPDLVSEGASVVDAGTGTGVLAIAAARLGAARVVAFDTDPWSVTNANENVRMNSAAHLIRILHGDLSVIEDRHDVVLANINRNVLLEYLPRFHEHLVPQGRLAMAGLLLSDRDVMTSALRAEGFEIVRDASEGEWWSVVARKTSRPQAE